MSGFFIASLGPGGVYLFMKECDIFDIGSSGHSWAGDGSQGSPIVSPQHQISLYNRNIFLRIKAGIFILRESESQIKKVVARVYLAFPP